MKITREFLPCPVVQGWDLGRHRKQLCLKRSCCKRARLPTPQKGPGAAGSRGHFTCPSDAATWALLHAPALSASGLSGGTGTSDECSAVSLRTLAHARDQLEASAGVCSRQMALSDLAPGNCARHATLGGTAGAWASRVASGADLVGPTANRRV